MFSLIITIISIALVAALALATLYYGGSAFNKGAAQAEASKVVLQGQQLMGAADLYFTEKREWPTSLNVLVDGGYLKQIPIGALMLPGDPLSNAQAAGQPWTLPKPRAPMFVLGPMSSEEVCSYVNLSGSLRTKGVPRKAYTNLAMQCYGDTDQPMKTVIKKLTDSTSLDDATSATPDTSIEPGDIVVGPGPVVPEDWREPPNPDDNTDDNSPPVASEGPVTNTQGLEVISYYEFGPRAMYSNSLFHQVTLRNAGTEPISVFDVSAMRGDNFAGDANTCQNAVLAAGQTCVAELQFAPVAMGPLYDGVAIYAEKGGAQFIAIVSVSGTGTFGTLTCVSPEVDLGGYCGAPPPRVEISAIPSPFVLSTATPGAVQGAKSLTGSFLVKNTGTVDVLVYEARREWGGVINQEGGGNFMSLTLDGCHSGSDYGPRLSPGQTCTMTAQLTWTNDNIAPPVTANFPVSIFNWTDYQQSSIDVNITGIMPGSAALGDVLLDAGDVDFGSVGLGSGAHTSVVQVLNDSLVPITNVAVAITGDASYTVSNNCPTPLPGNGSCEVTVSYEATAAGTHTASLTITANGLPAHVLPVTGKTEAKNVLVVNAQRVGYTEIRFETSCPAAATMLTSGDLAGLKVLGSEGSMSGVDSGPVGPTAGFSWQQGFGKFCFPGVAVGTDFDLETAELQGALGLIPSENATYINAATRPGYSAPRGNSYQPVKWRTQPNVGYAVVTVDGQEYGIGAFNSNFSHASGSYLSNGTWSYAGQTSSREYGVFITRGVVASLPMLMGNVGLDSVAPTLPPTVQLKSAFSYTNNTGVMQIYGMGPGQSVLDVRLSCMSTPGYYSVDQLGQLTLDLEGWGVTPQDCLTNVANELRVTFANSVGPVTVVKTSISFGP